MRRETGLGIKNSGGAHPKRWRSPHLTDNRVKFGGPSSLGPVSGGPKWGSWWRGGVKDSLYRGSG